MASELQTGGSADARGKQLVSPYLLVLGAAILWSTGGLFIKWNDLTPLELSCGRALFACATSSPTSSCTRRAATAKSAPARDSLGEDARDFDDAVYCEPVREGFRLNFVTGVAAVLYAALLLLFVVATKLTTAANAIFLQYTAPVYILLFEPYLFKEKYRAQDFVVVACCARSASGTDATLGSPVRNAVTRLSFANVPPATGRHVVVPVSRGTPFLTTYSGISLSRSPSWRMSTKHGASTIDATAR